MAHAEICPVCGGKGKIPIPTDERSTAAPGEETCHGCNGKGWVQVGVEYLENKKSFLQNIPKLNRSFKLSSS